MYKLRPVNFPSIDIIFNKCYFNLLNFRYTLLP